MKRNCYKAIKKSQSKGLPHWNIFEANEIITIHFSSKYGPFYLFIQTCMTRSVRLSVRNNISTLPYSKKQTTKTQILTDGYRCMS